MKTVLKKILLRYVNNYETKLREINILKENKIELEENLSEIFQ
jgi:hypothetical protein